MRQTSRLAGMLAELDGLQSSLAPLRSPAMGSPTLSDPRVAVSAAKRLNRAAGLLAASVLLDSAIEHYRGSFKNPAMVTPLVVGTTSLLTSLHGIADGRADAHHSRHASYWMAALTGLSGTLFHIYNVLKRPGRLAWQNLFYGAPIGAPFAILLSGLLGSTAEQVRYTRPGAVPRAFHGPAGRMIALVSGLGLLGTVGEAGLLHFRGAFQNPAMYVPVTIPPIGAVLLLNTAIGPARRDRWITRAWLKTIAAIGFSGVAFHAWGVHRNMGGWHNWRQTLLNGPPLPAPPSFTGLALAGLAALGLLEDHPDA